MVMEGPRNPGEQLEIQAIEITGQPSQYGFRVTVKSPDTGCDQYADWWEVITPEGELLYRRILLHSHVTEQPFTRSGSPVSISADQEVIVRGHMNNSGYSVFAMKGSVAEGFESVELEEEFAADLEEIEPLPEDCDF